MHIDENTKWSKSFPQTLTSSGVYHYTAIVESDEDIELSNNRLERIVIVKEAPRVLYLSDRKNIDNGLIKYLHDNKLEITYTNNLKELESDTYDLIILDNIAISNFNINEQKQLYNNIFQSGKSLLMLGGRKSFAIGGYAGTFIEDALPVLMTPERKEKLSVLILLDKSGSMSKEHNTSSSYLDLSKQAIMSISGLFELDDEFGIIAFDSQAEILLAPLPLKEKLDNNTIAKLLESLNASGGTSFYNPLNEAIPLLQNTQAELKHILLLSDGQAEKDEDLDLLLERLKSEKISLSTLALGKEADKILLYELADIGNGKFYEINNPNRLAEIFIMDILNITQPLLVEGYFQPQLDINHYILKDLHSFPRIHSYNPTSAKSLSEIPIKSPYQDPILAIGHCGLGRSAALTLNLNNANEHKIREWYNWQEQIRFWEHLSNWLLVNTIDNPQLQLECELKNENMIFTLSVLDSLNRASSGLNWEGLMSTPEGKIRRMKLDEINTGIYYIKFPLNETGIYNFHFNEKDFNELRIEKQINYSYPEEYHYNNANLYFLKLLSENTGGKIIKDIEIAKKYNIKSIAKTIYPLNFLFITLSLFLYILELALRKIGKIEKIRNLLSGK